MPDQDVILAEKALHSGPDDAETPVREEESVADTAVYLNGVRFWLITISYVPLVPQIMLTRLRCPKVGDYGVYGQSRDPRRDYVPGCHRQRAERIRQFELDCFKLSAGLFRFVPSSSKISVV